MHPLSGSHHTTACRLPHWVPACAQWVRTVESICKNFHYSDAPWEYLERTNSAILGAALTECRVPAMPETYVMRNGRPQNHERVDLCLVRTAGTSTILELVECKELEREGSAIVRAIASRLKDAYNQVHNITGIHRKQISSLAGITTERTIVVIGLPEFKSTTPASSVEANVQQLLSDLVGMPLLDVVAWCFPQQYILTPSTRYGKFYPGVFLAVQKA